MVQHITPEELQHVNMLLFLQRMAGIQTGFSEMIDGWRALSEPAKESVIEAYNGMVDRTIMVAKKGPTDVVREHCTLFGRG
jgi:hypothetical protein